MRTKSISVNEIDVGDVVLNNGIEHIVVEIITVPILDKIVIKLVEESKIAPQYLEVYNIHCSSKDNVSLILSRNYDVKTKYEINKMK